MSKFNAAFWKWFGDSKVVDADDQPLVVWHAGTVGDKFDVRRCELGCHFGAEKHAGSISAWTKASAPKPYYLRIRNPLRLKDACIFDAGGVAWQLEALGIIDGETSSRLQFEMKEKDADALMRSKILEAGYDGIVYLNRHEGIGGDDTACSTDDMTDDEFLKAFPNARDSWMIFSGKQAKLAEGNDGTFDADDPDIRSNPMTKKLYHVTLAENLPKIQKQGIKPQKKSLWTGALGQKLSRDGAIYAFDVFDDAARWAFKTEFDTQKPVAILEFEPHPTSWIQDQHWQVQMGKGWWLMSYRPVKPAEIKYVIEMEDKIRRALVKTLGADTQVMPDGKIIPFAGKTNLW